MTAAATKNRTSQRAVIRNERAQVADERRRGISRKDAALRYGVGLDTIDELIRSNAVRSRLIGRRRVIDFPSIEEWWEGLDDGDA